MKRTSIDVGQHVRGELAAERDPFTGGGRISLGQTKIAVWH